jgi:hypothetical protein
VLLHRTPSATTFYVEVQGATRDVLAEITLHVHVSHVSPVGCSAPLDLGAGATMLAWTHGDTGEPMVSTDCAGWPTGNVDLLALGASTPTTLRHISAFTPDFSIQIATTDGDPCAAHVTGAQCGMVTSDMPSYHYALLDGAHAPGTLFVSGIPRGDPTWVGQYLITVSP